MRKIINGEYNKYREFSYEELEDKIKKINFNLLNEFINPNNMKDLGDESELTKEIKKSIKFPVMFLTNVSGKNPQYQKFEDTMDSLRL